VKNRVKLEFDLKERLTKLIEEYVHEHRPVLLRGWNEPWLFPGESGGHKTLATLGDQITEAVWNRVGIRVTPHQYRHAAAAIIIRMKQDYELARRVLGHKNLNTTTKFYLASRPFTRPSASTTSSRLSSRQTSLRELPHGDLA
jgi:site-specific recombinase XerD